MASVPTTRTTLSLLLPLLLLLVQLHRAAARVYKKCELARELKHRHGLPHSQIATWVCIAKHESNYDTAAVNRGSGDHGLFQISDVYWCSPPGSGYACNRPCSAFEDDDIADDVVCIRRIFNEHRRISGDGFNAWVVYPLYCKGDVTSYTADCFDGLDNTIEGEEPDHQFNVTGEKPTGGGDEYEDVYEFPPLPVFPKMQEMFASHFSGGYDSETNVSYPQPSTRGDGGGYTKKYHTQKESTFEDAGVRTGSGFGGNEDVTIKYYHIQKEPAFTRSEDVTIKYYHVQKEPAFTTNEDVTIKYYHIQKEPDFEVPSTTTDSGFEGHRPNLFDDTTTKNYQIQKEPSFKDTGTITGLDFERNQNLYEDTTTKKYQIQEEPSFKDSGSEPGSSLEGNRQNFYEDAATDTYHNNDDFYQYPYKDDNTKKPIDHEDSYRNFNKLTTSQTFTDNLEYSYKDVTTKKYQNAFNDYDDKTTKTEKPQFLNTFPPSFGDHTTRRYSTFENNEIPTTEKSQLHKFHSPSYQETTTKEPYKATHHQSIEAYQLHKFHSPSYQETTTKEPYKVTYYQSTKPTVKKSNNANNKDHTVTTSPYIDSTKTYKKGRTRPFRFTTFKPFTFRSLIASTAKTYVQETTTASSFEVTTSTKSDRTYKTTTTFQEPSATTIGAGPTTHDYYTTTQKHVGRFTLKPLPPLNLPRPVSFRPLPTRKPITFKPFTTRRPLPIKPLTVKLPISFKPFTTRRPFAKVTAAGRSLSTLKLSSTRPSFKPFTLKPFTPFTKKYHASDKKSNATNKTAITVSLDTTITPVPLITKSTKTHISTTQKPSTTTAKPLPSSSTTRRPFSTLFPIRKFTNKITSSATTTSETPSSREAKDLKEPPNTKEVDSAKKSSSKHLVHSSDSKTAPHQTFYDKADELQYNFFTKTYGFKLVGQF